MCRDLERAAPAGQLIPDNAHGPDVDRVVVLVHLALQGEVVDGPPAAGGGFQGGIRCQPLSLENANVLGLYVEMVLAIAMQELGPCSAWWKSFAASIVIPLEPPFQALRQT